MRGELRAVITTDALELGIDIGELDAAVVVTFPGTVASLRQMWGRAGRRGRGLAVYVAGEDALDQFFCRHPEDFLERPVEAAILDHESPLIYRAHLLCAAHEGPLSRERRRVPRPALGGPRRGAAERRRAAPPRRRPRRRQPTCPRRPRRLPRGGGLAALGLAGAASRSSTSPPASCSARPRPRAPTRPSTRARSTCTSGAPTRCASSTSSAAARWSRRSTATGTRSPSARPTPTIERLLDRRETLGVTLVFGEVERHRHRARLPAQARSPTTRRSTSSRSTCRRRASPRRRCGSSCDAERARARRSPLESLLGALHATEHAQIAVLPLIAMCDRWDIGGLSTNFHPQTGGADDLHLRRAPRRRSASRAPPSRASRSSARTRCRLIAECPCASGCPSCVQSPKCGNLNEPLSKAGARRCSSGCCERGGARRRGAALNARRAVVFGSAQPRATGRSRPAARKRRTCRR